VEFGDVPRAYSVLAYGESNRPNSPWLADQAELFAKGELKKVAFTEAEVNAQSVVRYRPGEKRQIKKLSVRPQCSLCNKFVESCFSDKVLGG
jgi:hypothetical protein